MIALDDDAPLAGERQWPFGPGSGYIYAQGRRLSIIAAAGMTPATTRELAALLIEAADAVEGS